MSSARIAPSMLCIVLAGCAVVRAPYQPVAPEVPAHWSEASGPGAAVSQANLAWWESFNDAELTSLIQRAATANLDVQLAQARLREARGRSGIASASLQPNVRASAAAVRERESQNAPAPVLFGVDGNIERPGQRPDNLFQAGFDASWEFDLFGAQRQAIVAAHADLDAVAYERGGVLVTLFAEVARNYVILRGLQQQIMTARADLAAQQTSASLVRARHAGGLASNLDIARVDAQVKVLAAQLPPLDAARQHAMHRLGILLGQAPGALGTELSQARPIIPVARPDLLVGLPSDLLRQRPDIQRAERQLAAAAARLGVATADLYPKFSLNGAAGLASASAGDFFSAASLLWKIGPTMTWPILRRGQIVASIEVHDAQQQQALLAYRSAILKALEEVENAIVAYTHAQARRAALADAVQEHALALELSRSRYLGGLADMLDVLDADHHLAALKSELIQGEVAVATTLVALHKSLGGGWRAVSASATSPCLVPDFPAGPTCSTSP